jgi:hypothetical protein
MGQSVDTYLRSNSRALYGWLSLLAGLLMAVLTGLLFVWGPLWESSLFALASLEALFSGAVVHPRSRKRIADSDLPLVNGKQ